MKWRRSWNIHTRTQLISVGPALLLTLLLTGFLTFNRLQDLRLELNNTGQLIASQLAPATEYGVISGNRQVLESLLQATLKTPHVRFVEVRDRDDAILVYLEQPETSRNGNGHIDLFEAPIQQQLVDVGQDFIEEAVARAQPLTGEYLGRVIVGMSSDAINPRQQEVLLKVTLLVLFALLLTFLLARRLARHLAQPLSAMSQAVTAIQQGNYQATLPEPDNGELSTLARHINNLAHGLNNASLEQQQAIALLIKAREESDLANRAKSDFLAMMSHELRTPMNGVLGMLQLLETTEMTPEQEEYAALATESTEHLLKVINDILDFSRIERGALELELIDFHLPTLLRSSLQAFQHSARQRELALTLQLPDNLTGQQVQGDPTRIRQILVNLIGNALKFTERGSVSVEATWQALDQQILWFTCRVRDTGIGISKERLDTMFDAFQQADNSISRRYGGTGLGLPIARTLAEHMGGTLQAHSEPGRGSCFTLEIPLPLSEPQTANTPAELPAEPTLQAARTVLLVEDNQVNQTVIEAMLRSLGYQVRLAVDGVQAIAAIEHERFAAVLMDCRLPTMDGYEATRHIRQLASATRLPIIALTANALQGDREACLQAGMNDYLAKPFKRTDLQQVLERWLTPPP